MKPIKLTEKLSLFDELWSPKIVSQLNDYHIKLAKVAGDFVWHDHPETDELFYVVSGTLFIELRGETIRLEAGEMVVIPKGVEHRPYAPEECHIMLIEPAGTVNTGSASEAEGTTGDWI